MRRLGFTSDAGYRFERGVDFDGCAPRGRARDRSSILEICGGRAGPLTDRVAAPTCPARDAGARARRRAITRVLGVDDLRTTTSPASSRGSACAFERDGGDFVVTPPTRRFDLAIEEDFVEEVARIHGYDAHSRRPSARTSRACCPAPEGRAAARCA